MCENKNTIIKKYDLLLARPMAGARDDDHFRAINELTIKILDKLKSKCKLKNIYCVGREIKSMNHVKWGSNEAKEHFAALSESRYYMMIYPEKTVTSILPAAGFAIALNIPSVYFVKNKQHLPFVLREAPEAFGIVKIFEYRNNGHLLSIIDDLDTKIFDFS